MPGNFHYIRQLTARNILVIFHHTILTISLQQVLEKNLKFPYWLLTVDCWLLTIDCWLLTVDYCLSHFCLPISIYIKRVYVNSVRFLVGWVKSAESRLLAIRLITSPDQVLIAESLNPTHYSDALWYFRPKEFDYLITYMITIYYYIHYLSRRSKIR